MTISLPIDDKIETLGVSFLYRGATSNGSMKHKSSVKQGTVTVFPCKKALLICLNNLSFINLLIFQDSFKYSYPPLVDDDFQTPLCENGPITSEDEHESKEEIDADTKEAGEINEAQNLNQKKVSK